MDEQTGFGRWVGAVLAVLTLLVAPVQAETVQTAVTAASAASVGAGTVTAAAPSDCSSCHGASVAADHHQSSYFLQGECSFCHQGVTTGGDCASCHRGGLQGNSHHLAVAGDLGRCTECHAAGAELGNCRNCHAGKVQTRHHEIAAAGIGCGTCHPGLVTRPGCRDCHAQTRQTHHTSTTGLSLDCSSCHSQIAPLPDCRGCHASGSTRSGHHAAATAGDCGSCHAGGAPLGNCGACHQGTNGAVHHASSAYAAGQCGTCHAPSTPVESGCRSCHVFNETVGNVHHNLSYIWTTYALGCRDCHVFPNGATTPRPVLPADCLFCHDTFPQLGVAREAHHALPVAAGGDCAFCHAGGGRAGQDCAACHGPGVRPPTAASHHATAAGNGDCTFCHAVGSVAATDCRSCHEARVSIAEGHHMTVPAQLNQCGACHAGIAPASLQCETCHGGPTQPAIASRHHATSTGVAGLCADCHAATPEAIPCAVCHASPDKHHGQPQAVAGDCAFCHGQPQFLGGSCGACHTTPVPQLHHADPLAAVGGNCAACHQSISTPDVCANCHAQTSHHSTSWSVQGDCAHCHAVPVWAADRPAQAACRECHGTQMHGKGGPIKNYGSCAACHSQAPFHAAPTTIPGYAGYGAGKRKFNIFWSKYAIKEGPGERISPNGEAVNDEGGYKIKAQQLPYAMTQIVSGGRSYAVPYFPLTGVGNLALGKSASASRAESGYAAGLAVDGNTGSRWWAKSETTQWLKIDLGTKATVGRVVLRWHSYYAGEYEVRVSADNLNWTRVVDANAGKGGLEEWKFTPVAARYVQIYCQRATSSNGYGLYEVEVYAP